MRTETDERQWNAAFQRPAQVKTIAMDGRQIPSSRFLNLTWYVWAGLVVAYAVVGASLPPMDDEVYYWTWSQTPQLSYYDHPGMTAWLIWLSTMLFGDTVLGMRFPAAICTAFTLAVITYLTTAKSTSLSSAGQWIVIGVSLSPLFVFGGLLITPDAPLIASWAAYLVWMVSQHELLASGPSHRREWLMWLIGGVLLGLGGLSKYTMILAVPAGFVSLVVSGLPWRRWIIGYMAHGIIAMVVASPILTYNLQHDFEPLLFQWRHAMQDEPATPITFLEFFGVQFLLFGSLPFFLAVWSLRNFRTLRMNPGLRVCGVFHLVPLIFFIYKATQTELEGNWGLVAFLSVWPVAAAWYETVKDSRLWRWLTAASFLPPAIASLGLIVLLVVPISFLPPQLDRLSKQRARWEMSQELASAIESRGETIPTFTSTYQMTALLRFHGVDARQEGNSRPSHFTFPRQSFEDFPAAYYVSDAKDVLPWTYHQQKLLGTFATNVRGQVVQEYQLWRLVRKDRRTF